jgi:LAO/AO transport system kinase
MRTSSPAELLARARAGEIRAIARLLTRAESGDAAFRAQLDELFAAAGRAHVVGITGVPGSGKSTLVAALTARIRTTGRKVGIIAIDPSSPYSGGAILGDRVRMNALMDDPGVFVRSLATRGALGGLSRGAMEAVDVLDAAGYEVILIETVGVGQDEIDISQAAHTTIVVSAPGLGDDIQAIKAGVLEIADIHAVSKCDRPDASRTLAELKAMLALGQASVRAGGWTVPVLATSSEAGSGIDELMRAMDRHWAMLQASGELQTRRAQIHQRRLLKAAEELVREGFARQQQDRLEDLMGRLNARAISPATAARELLESIRLDAGR